MEKIKKILRDELVLGHSTFDKVYLISMLLLQIVVFIIAPESWIAIVSGIAGVISVVLCAKGKISFYFIGFVQTFSYLYLAYTNQFYGEVIENVFYLVTMVIGIFIWKKNLDKSEEDGANVKALKMSGKQWVISIGLTIVATLALGYGLTLINSAQAYTDAATNIFAIFAQILMIKRYREQWVWWLAVDLFCIKLWFVAGNWTMVAMYIAWTINCIYGWVNWTKLTKQNQKNLT